MKKIIYGKEWGEKTKEEREAINEAEHLERVQFCKDFSAKINRSALATVADWQMGKVAAVNSTTNFVDYSCYTLAFFLQAKAASK